MGYGNKVVIWIAPSVEAPLSREDYKVWYRWLFWGLDESSVHGWSYDRLPNSARSMALMCLTEKKFRFFQVRNRNDRCDEHALFGTTDEPSRDYVESGTWTLLA